MSARDERIAMAVGRLEGLLVAAPQINSHGEVCVMVSIDEANRLIRAFRVALATKDEGAAHAS